MPLTLQDLIKAIEESTVLHRCDDGWDHNLIDADILLAELKKMEEPEKPVCSGSMEKCPKKHRPFCNGCFKSCPECN